MDKSPIIVYGSVRAGTTMFRMMLSAHPDLVEIGENRYLVDCLRNGGNGQLHYDFDRLEMDRVFRMRGLSRPEGFDGPDLVASLVAQLRDGRDGPIVLTFHADIQIIERLFPGARYIHIFRDPRAVAASAVNLGWAGNVYYGADFWLASEESWEDFKKDADPSRYIEICYENLAQSSHELLREVCAFLGIEFTEEMLEYDKNSTYSKPDPKMTTRWKSKLTPRQIELVELKCGALMEQRGYSRDFKSDQQAGISKRGFLAIDNKVRKAAADISFFGLQDYSLEKLYRLPIFKKRYVSLVHRMQDTVNKSLK